MSTRSPPTNHEGTSGSDARIPNMDNIEQERLRRRLADLKRLLLQTTDAAAATILSNDIADMETRLRASTADLVGTHRR